jgi:hypothetical protein
MKSIFSVVGFCVVLGACATGSEQTVVAPQQPVGEPPGIAGLAAADVKLAWGEPAFVRHDGASQLWRYDGQTCRAFFFLYDQGGVQKVRHVETLPRGTTMPADVTCLDALRLKPAAPPPKTS